MNIYPTASIIYDVLFGCSTHFYMYVQCKFATSPKSINPNIKSHAHMQPTTKIPWLLVSRFYQPTYLTFFSQFAFVHVLLIIIFLPTHVYSDNLKKILYEYMHSKKAPWKSPHTQHTTWLLLCFYIPTDRSYHNIPCL